MQGKELTVGEQNQIVLTPDEVVSGATAQAKLLMDIVEKAKCYQQIGNKKYLQVEAWETIGAFNRTHAETEHIAPIFDEGDEERKGIIGYQAHVQLWKDGNVVGGAIMPCYFTDNCCKGKAGDAKHKACMSAAQTFATSKAYRMNYSYVAILAGFQPTPAEEMVEDNQPETKEHWCEQHKTEFFKKGNMKGYAHPIGDTGEWCNEGADKPSAKPPVAPVAQKEAPAPSGGGNDKGEAQKLQRDPSTIKNATELFKACSEDWPDKFKSTKDVNAALGIKAWLEWGGTVAEAYTKIAGVMQK